MLTITLFYALFTILIVGSILNPILERCDVLAKEETEQIAEEDNEGEQGSCCLKFKKKLVEFDQRWFAPVFIRAVPPKPKTYDDNQEQNPQNLQLQERQSSAVDWSLNDTETDDNSKSN